MKSILLVLIIISTNAFAQQSNNPEWRNYLNSESVQAIAEEGDFLWIGSQAGMTRLNKLTYEKEFYNKGNTILPTNIIFDVKVDKLGYKWVATFRGLVKFKDDNWILYDTTNSGIPKNDIRTIEIDSLDNIWIGTRGGGVGKFDGSSWEVFNTSNSNLPSDFINDLEFETSNLIWIGTTGGLVKKDGNNWTVFNTSNSGLTVDHVFVIKIDKNKNKWIGVVKDRLQNSFGGVFKFDDTNWVNFMPTRPNRIYNAVYSIVIDDQNNKWIAANSYDPAYAGGIFLIDSLDAAIQVVDYLPRWWVNKIYEDKQGIKWLGGQNGFLKYDQLTEWIYISNSKFSHNRISGLQINKQTNNKYFSAYADIPLSVEYFLVGFFSILHDTAWSIYDMSNSPILAGVFCFTTTNTGEIYAAEYQSFINEKLYKFDGVNWIPITTPITQFNFIRNVFWDDEKLWVYFGADILFQFSNENWTEITGYPAYSLSQIIKWNNNYWFASDVGLIKYESGSWTSFTSTNSGLPHNSIRCLAVDKLNNLWIGTYNGLAKFDGTNWTIFNSENSPLIYDNVSALVCDNFNKIYIGTDYGLFKKNSDNWKFFNSYNSGLPNGYATLYGYFIDDHRINALAVDTLNNIWIATNGGIGVYDEDGLPLPIELSSFTALVENTTVLLNWNTATELNNR